MNDCDENKNLNRWYEINSDDNKRLKNYLVRELKLVGTARDAGHVIFLACRIQYTPARHKHKTN